MCASWRAGRLPRQGAVSLARSRWDGRGPAKRCGAQLGVAGARVVVHSRARAHPGVHKRIPALAREAVQRPAFSVRLQRLCGRVAWRVSVTRCAGEWDRRFHPSRSRTPRTGWNGRGLRNAFAATPSDPIVPDGRGLRARTRAGVHPRVSAKRCRPGRRTLFLERRDRRS